MAMRAGPVDVDRCLYTDRSIVKQLAMRRTVFAFPRDLLPAVRGSAAARVANQQAAQLARSVVAGGLATDGTPTPVAPRVLTVLAAGGGVVRGANDGGWTVSRPHWTPTETWLDSSVPPLPEAEGYAELVRRWLWAFGPGADADITWWLCATKTAVRRALADVGAAAVRLDDGSPAWLHPEDVDEVRSAASWAALLPALDPTTMGWRGRGFYVDKPTAAAVYDRAGNGKPSAWWDGRIVGRWVQEEDGTVVVIPATPLTGSATAALNHEAAQLTLWLDGAVIRSGFQSPLRPERQLHPVCSPRARRWF